MSIILGPNSLDTAVSFTPSTTHHVLGTAESDNKKIARKKRGEVSFNGFVHGLQSRFNFIVVIGRAVAGEQEFQHEGRDVRPLLDALDEILADHPAGKDLIQFGA